MTQTIIGVFDSFERANRAADRLADTGISRSHLDVHAQHAAPGAYATTTPTAAGATVHHDHDRSFMQKVEDFFANLFGTNDRPEEVGHYQEAVRRGSALLTVSDIEESKVAAVRTVLESEGAADIDLQVSRWKEAGYTGFNPETAPYSAEEAELERQAFPVVQEELAVGKREVETGAVRVYSRATSTPVSESVRLREEHATIERRAVDRPATTADLREGSIEVRETAEEAVVGKSSRVVEEVVVGKTGSEHTETINETLRGTDVEVERVEGERVVNKTGVVDPLDRNVAGTPGQGRV